MLSRGNKRLQVPKWPVIMTVKYYFWRWRRPINPAVALLTIWQACSNFVVTFKCQIWPSLIEAVKRYFWPELIGTATALFSVWWFLEPGQSYWTAAATGTIGEAIGFYIAAFVIELTRQYRRNTRKGPLRTIGRTALKIISEFGPTEAIDTLFLRPFIMLWLLHVTDNLLLGILIGKLVTDIVFYTLAFFSHKLTERWEHQPETRPQVFLTIAIFIALHCDLRPQSAALATNRSF